MQMPPKTQSGSMHAAREYNSASAVAAGSLLRVRSWHHNTLSGS